MAQPGRPTAVIELTDTERETLQRWVRRHSSGTSLGVAVQDRVGLRGWCHESGGGRGSRGASGHGFEVAAQVRGGASGGTL
jgi:hypothetical protein